MINVEKTFDIKHKINALTLTAAAKAAGTDFGLQREDTVRQLAELASLLAEVPVLDAGAETAPICRVGIDNDGALEYKTDSYILSDGDFTRHFKEVPSIGYFKDLTWHSRLCLLKELTGDWIPWEWLKMAIPQ